MEQISILKKCPHCDKDIQISLGGVEAMIPEPEDEVVDGLDAEGGDDAVLDAEGGEVPEGEGSRVDDIDTSTAESMIEDISKGKDVKTVIENYIGR